MILQIFWKTSFVTFLRDMSGKDWNPIFRIDRLNISMRREAEFLLFCSLTEMNFLFFAGLNFFPPGIFDAMLIFGTSQS